MLCAHDFNVAFLSCDCSLKHVLINWRYLQVLDLHEDLNKQGFLESGIYLLEIFVILVVFASETAGAGYH